MATNSDTGIRASFSLSTVSAASKERERRRRRTYPEEREKERSTGGSCYRKSMGDLFSWLICFFILIALLVIIVYQLTCLADLEFDYINAYDSASRINKVMVPEFLTHGGLCLFFLLTGRWLMALLYVPYLCYNVKMYMENQHLVDVTEIFNLLDWEKKKRLYKLAYLGFILFLSLFLMIWSALEDDEQYQLDTHF